MKKAIEAFQSCFSLRASIIGSLFLAASIFLIAGVLTVAKYEIQWDDNGVIFNSQVYSKTVQDALKEAKIQLGEHDELSCSLEDEVRNFSVISVKRAKEITLAHGMETQIIYTTLDTVEELLTERKVPLGEENLLLIPLSDPLEEGMTIEVIPKVYEEVTVAAEVPFGIEEKASVNMERGRTRTIKEGEPGLKETVYKVLKHKGEVLEQVKVGENIVKKPVNKVVEYGTIASIQTSRGENFRYSRVIHATATAYSIKGRTATGRQTARGVVAVDPSVIPLGSRLYIQSANGKFVYGYAIAADTGGSIKGNKVDLYMDTRNECLSFGVQPVQVYVLE